MPLAASTDIILTRRPSDGDVRPQPCGRNFKFMALALMPNEPGLGHALDAQSLGFIVWRLQPWPSSVVFPL